MSDWRRLAEAEFQTTKRPATAARGMVVANHPLGAVAGVEMLAAGGNAIDAAVTTLFALTVVEPMMVGIFGAGMSTMRLANGEHRFVNNYTTAPGAATPDMYQPVSNSWPDYQVVEGRKNDVGVLAVGVPGNLLGWSETLASHGTLSLSEAMQPAIRYAENGFRASKYLADIVRLVQDDIARFPATAATWLPGGQGVKVGQLVRQPDYAATLRAIAREGPELLYGGALGRMAVDYIRSAGGIVSLADLEQYRTMPADVVRGSYRGCDIVGPPPPTAGGVHVIEILNILEGFDVAGLGFGTVDGVHLLAEALAIGFEDRRRYMGDPAFVDVPTAMLIDKGYATRRRTEIDMNRKRNVATGYVPEANATTHVAAADAEGNVVAATHTIHSPFGSKATVPGTGNAPEQHHEHLRPAPGDGQLHRPRQARHQQHVAHRRRTRRQALVLRRPGRRHADLSRRAAGHRQRRRPRHVAPGGRRSAPGVDAGRRPRNGERASPSTSCMGSKHAAIALLRCRRWAAAPA